jgi:hypothetical protein
MRTSKATLWVVSGLLMSLGLAATFAWGQAPASGSAVRTDAGGRRIVGVRVTNLPAQSIMVRTITGSFRQHATLVPEMLAHARSIGLRDAARGGILGIYPMDPDAVDNEKDLEWYLALTAPPNATAAKLAVSPGMLANNVRADFGTLESKALTLPHPADNAPFHMAPIVEGTAIVAEVGYPEMAAVGSSMMEFMVRNNMVQTAPTRTLLVAGDPDAMAALPQGTLRPAALGARRSAAVLAVQRLAFAGGRPAIALASVGPPAAMPPDPNTPKIQIIIPAKKRPRELPVAGVMVMDRNEQMAKAHANDPNVVMVDMMKALPERTVILRAMKGALAKQQDTCAEALRQAPLTAAARTQATCTRIDLVDPDLAPDAEWQLAIDAPKDAKAAAPFALTKLPAVRAIVRETTPDRVELERLAITAWYIRMGCVQTAPTRIEYTPGKSTVRLIIPLKPRVRQVPVEWVVAEEIPG